MKNYNDDFRFKSGDIIIYTNSYGKRVYEVLDNFNYKYDYRLKVLIDTHNSLNIGDVISRSYALINEYYNLSLMDILSKL